MGYQTSPSRLYFLHNPVQRPKEPLDRVVRIRFYQYHEFVPSQDSSELKKILEYVIIPNYMVQQTTDYHCIKAIVSEW